MTLLVLGVLLWSSAHLFPCLGVSARQRLIHRLGAQPYRGVFSLVILASVVLMVLGWRASDQVNVYVPPPWALPAAELLMFVALVLFVASGLPSNLKRIIRHPQLTGLVVWSGSHLLANGHRRSLVLFGGLGLWAILGMLLLNRRDGEWKKPPPSPATTELKLLLISVVVYAILFVAHPYFTGVTLPRLW